MELSSRLPLAQKVHKLNNLLGIIQGCAELLLLGLPGEEERAEMLQEISRASDSAAHVIASLGSEL
jgi:signal transduction histidine kinase